MQDPIPKRPTVLLPILIVIATSLLCILPPQAQYLISAILRTEEGTRDLPSWVSWLLPLIAVAVLGGYAVYLQWIDQRRYDAIMTTWNGLAETNGFRPLADLAYQNAPAHIRKVIEMARKKGSFVVPVMDDGLVTLIMARLELDDEGESDWVRRGSGSYFIVHPDLLKKPRS